MINLILLSVLISFIISQFVKFIILYVKKKKHALESIYREYGGMPSTHTAVVSALVFSIYFMEGISNLFFVSLIFAAIIVADVIDSRWFYGKRDDILNELIKKYNSSEKTKIQEIEGDIGHTLLEVFVGVLIGFSVSLSLLFV